MPTLNWIGREAVINHHNEIPYRLLRCNGTLSAGDSDNGNLLVEGDNLEALKALLPYYAGRVKCIYIDPPYNTGEENWIYSDSVDSPIIQAWLGTVVGKDVEDLSRHDKWLCMMYPRLRLLWEFLSDDGTLWMSLDDNEIHHARAILDEIFGQQGFVATVVWQKRTSPDARLPLGPAHDYIVVYAKSREQAKKTLHLLPLTGTRAEDYKNPDNDPRGTWASVDLTGQIGHATPSQFYEMVTPAGKRYRPPEGRCWALVEDTFKQLVEEGRIWFGKDGNSRPRLKRYSSEVEGTTAWTWWPNTEVGHNQEATKELKYLLGGRSVFETPKPTRLIKRILQLATDRDSIVLDSFAGSGTTGHAVLQMNKEDGGHRRFILVELESEIARTITAERLRRAVEGYEFTGTERTPLFEEKLTVTAFRKASEILEEMESIKEEHRDEYDGFERRIENGRVVLYGKIKGFKEGLGTGFRYCTLGSSLFDETGAIRSEVSFSDLAAHIYFTETGEPLPEPSSLDSPWIAQSSDTAYYLFFNGVRGGSQLDARTLRQIEEHTGPVVVYARTQAVSRAGARPAG
jgi:adenine-specific DNA-methyltransferase